MSTIAYLNGHFVPNSECVLPIYDTGIVMGASVTDFLRTFNHQPYRLEDHVHRFYRSCKYARIEPPVSIEQTLEISRKIIEHNSPSAGGKELGLVYYMTAGENPAYAGAAGLPGDMKPTYVQHSFPLLCHLWRDHFIKGIHCITPAVRHWPPQCLSSKIKHRNRLHMWIGDQEIKKLDPKAVALYMDVDGNITETGGSNFVIYREGTVASPRRTNILWGVSLQVLTEILTEMRIPFLEDDIQTYDVINADEAWMPSSPYSLAPVVKINSTPIGDGKPGPMWRKIISRWSEIVKKNIYSEMVDGTGKSGHLNRTE